MRRLAVLLLCGSSLFAGDLAGVWTGQIAGRNGEKVDVAFKFTHIGNTLTGKLYGEYQSAPIVEGKVTGDQLDFIVVAQEQSGNQISDTRWHYTGIVKDGDIELTREREGSTNAGNGGSFQARNNNGKLTFHVKPIGANRDATQEKPGE